VRQEAADNPWFAMADVWPVDDRYRLPLALDAALILAPLSAVQTQIARSIVHLTLGRRRGMVYLSGRALAEKCRRRYSGAFRRAVNALVQEQVLLRLERPRGRRPALYAVNLQHWQWGRFAVDQYTVQRLFNDRDSLDDSRFFEWQAKKAKAQPGQNPRTV
jgi:hypothetical protein